MDLRPWNYWTAGRASRMPGTDRDRAPARARDRREPESSGRLPLLHPRRRGGAPEKAAALRRAAGAALMPGVGTWSTCRRTSTSAWAATTTPIKATCTRSTRRDLHRRASSRRASIRSATTRTTSTSSPLPRPWRAGARWQSRPRGRWSTKINLDVARQVALLQEMVPYHVLTLMTFGRWDDVLAEPLPPADIRFPTAMAHYARGVAYAAKSEWAERPGRARHGDGDRCRDPRGRRGQDADLDIAVHALMGEIATRGGRAR